MLKGCLRSLVQERGESLSNAPHPAPLNKLPSPPSGPRGDPSPRRIALGAAALSGRGRRDLGCCGGPFAWGRGPLPSIPPQGFRGYHRHCLGGGLYAFPYQQVAGGPQCFLQAQEGGPVLGEGLIYTFGPLHTARAEVLGPPLLADTGLSGGLLPSTGPWQLCTPRACASPTLLGRSLVGGTRMSSPCRVSA